MNQFTDIQLYMIKFLRRHFPITKVKKMGDKRFRRGIIVSSGFTGVENKTFYINRTGGDFSLAYKHLARILIDVFGVGATDFNPVIYHHLNLF